MSASDFAMIETERLILRAPTEDDLQEWADLVFANPEVIRYMPKRDITPLERAQRAFGIYIAQWAEQGYGGWIIRDKADGQFIGNCELEYLPDTEEVELGYALAQSYWGKGIATEAARALTRFGFEVANLNRIMAVVVPDNTASWKVLEKLGFVYEKDDVYYDLKIVYYAIAREQFDPGNAAYRVISPGQD